MKEHNADYLSNHSLSLHPRLGIHAANIAPEFGVVETRAFIEILKKFNKTKLLEEFYEISYNSNKWKKWLVPNSNADKVQKAIISGHYIFSNKKFEILKKKVQLFLLKKNINLNNHLQKSIYYSIHRYAKNFNLIK